MDSSNVGIGSFALFYNLIDQNVAVGMYASFENTSGTGNVSMGYQALRENVTGSSNTAIGFGAGQNSTGTGNVYLGYQAGQNNLTSNKLFIDNSNDANPLLYGDFTSDVIRINGELQVDDPSGSGYAFPTADGTMDYVLQTDGAGQASWVDPSTLGTGDVDWNVGLGTSPPNRYC